MKEKNFFIILIIIIILSPFISMYFLENTFDNNQHILIVNEKNFNTLERYFKENNFTLAKDAKKIIINITESYEIAYIIIEHENTHENNLTIKDPRNNNLIKYILSNGFNNLILATFTILFSILLNLYIIYKYNYPKLNNIKKEEN